MPTLKDDIIKSFKGKHCSTCEQWQGRKPRCAGHWAGVKEVENAAYCEHDKAWHGATDYCEYYSPLPGSPMWNREEKRKIKTPKLSNKEIESESKMNRDGEINSEYQEDDEYVDDPEWDNALVFFVSLTEDGDSYVGEIGYRIVKLKCVMLPFLEEEFFPSLKFGKYKCVKDAENAIEGMAEKKLSSMGLSAKIVIKSRKVEESSLITYEKTGKFINLYIDIGSTNSKWIVSQAEAEVGTDKDIIEIGSPVSTQQICNEWGFSYDKERASCLDNHDFTKWISEAVSSIMMHFRKEHKADVFFIRWAFPRMVKNRSLDFQLVSSEVTFFLKKRGLCGDFKIIAESDALKEFFFDRLKELALANNNEEWENRNRELQAEKNAQYNKEERSRHEASLRKRYKEAQEWKKEHYIKRWFCDPEYKTDVYEVQYKNENWTKSTLMSAFRLTGAREDGCFNLLILDAGGMSLDYYYRSSDGSKKYSGSFNAGGNELTNYIKAKYNISFQEAEERKKTYYVGGGSINNSVFMDATRKVYENVLKTICKEIGDCKKQLCIVGTGLAMLNRQLRYLIETIFSLQKGQHVLWSPGIVDALPDEVYKKMPITFRTFDAIVRRRSKKDSGNLQPWPSNDVVGGLYFTPKSDDND